MNQNSVVWLKLQPSLLPTSQIHEFSAKRSLLAASSILTFSKHEEDDIASLSIRIETSIRIPFKKESTHINEARVTLPRQGFLDSSREPLDVCFLEQALLSSWREDAVEYWAHVTIGSKLYAARISVVDESSSKTVSSVHLSMSALEIDRPDASEQWIDLAWDQAKTCMAEFCKQNKAINKLKFFLPMLGSVETTSTNLILL